MDKENSWKHSRENHCFVFKAAGAAFVQNSLIYGEKQLNTANLRSKQGNQLRGVKIKKLSKKEKQKIRVLDWFHKNLQENEFTRLNQGLDNLGQFWRNQRKKGPKFFVWKQHRRKKNWVESAAEKPKDPFRQRPFKNLSRTNLFLYIIITYMSNFPSKSWVELQEEMQEILT